MRIQLEGRWGVKTKTRNRGLGIKASERGRGKVPKGDNLTHILTEM